MKIGILGNMNNMYFSMARYLADEGYDCELLIFDNEPLHFRPHADTFEGQYRLVVKQVDWGDPAHFLKKRTKAAADLAAYDFLIGNGAAPAFVHAAGRVIDLFVPYGEDLYRYPFSHFVHPVRQLSYWTMAWHQLRGIRQSPHILFDKTNPEFDKVFERLKYRGNRITNPPPLFYSKEYDECLLQQEQKNPHFTELQELRNQNELLVLQHIRQIWKNRRDPWNMKGNDRLIRGYAQFLSNNSLRKTKLLLFEYGDDVESTKKLIAELKLQEHVRWFPKSLRKDLMLFIKASDVVVGELYYAWNTYCVALETLAMAKPFIHNRNDAYLADAYPELYPMFQASSPDCICRALESVAQNKEAAAEMGCKGRAWFEKYCVQEPLQKIGQLIEAKQKALHGQKSF
ncbi:glycosyltransferase [Flavisolibacter ginsenosidimutans]